MMRNTSVILLGAVVLCGCSNANVAGDYTVAVTNDSNGCMFTNYTVGSSTQNVPFTLQQNGSALSGTVGGLSGVALQALLGLGANSFTGTVSGSGINLTSNAPNPPDPMSHGACAYTLSATITGSLNGDAISGNITYRANTNNSSDCAYLSTCTTVQAFSGSRPPM